MRPYDAPSGTVWRYDNQHPDDRCEDENIFVVLDGHIQHPNDEDWPPSLRTHPFRRIFELSSGKVHGISVDSRMNLYSELLCST